MILENQFTTLPTKSGGKTDPDNEPQDHSWAEFDHVFEAGTDEEIMKNPQAEETEIDGILFLEMPGKISEKSVRDADSSLNRTGTRQIHTQPATLGSLILDTPITRIDAIAPAEGAGNNLGVSKDGRAAPIPDILSSPSHDGVSKGEIDLAKIEPLPVASKIFVEERLKIGLKIIGDQIYSEPTSNHEVKNNSQQPEKVTAGVKSDYGLKAASHNSREINTTGVADFPIAETLTTAKGSSNGASIDTIQFGNLSGLQFLSTPIAPSIGQPTLADTSTLPQRTIQLIAQTANMLQDHPVELTLNPEELGRVRMTLRPVEGSMAITISVERPETLELLRRNIDLLGSQLRDIGYEQFSFEFAGQGKEFSGENDGAMNQDAAHTDNILNAEETELPNPKRIDFSPEGGVDIRL